MPDAYPGEPFYESEGEGEGEGDEEEGQDEDATSPGSETAEDLSASKHASRGRHHPEPRHPAASELRKHEMLALASCFLFPLLGAYLLHTIRAQLSRPSEGLVSDYNLTIFVLAAEIRPLAHLIKIIQARTLFLQRMVSQNSYPDRPEDGRVLELGKRLEDVEKRLVSDLSVPAAGASSADPKSAATMTSEVRRTLQPDLDALNRAVRRYEKRATMQTMQTESRLLDLEARLGDALSLAAAAAQSGQRQRQGLLTILLDGMIAAMLLPLQALWSLVNLPIKALVTLVTVFGASTSSKRSARDRRGAASRYNAHGRLGGDRIQARSLRKG